MKYLLQESLIIQNLGDTIKNDLIYILKSKINIKVKGNNIERFIKRLKNNNIDILKLKYISDNEIVIRIYKVDLGKLMSIKTIYEITIISYLGLEKYRLSIINNKHIIISIVAFAIILN